MEMTKKGLFILDNEFTYTFSVQKTNDDEIVFLMEDEDKKHDESRIAMINKHEAKNLVKVLNMFINGETLYF